jgi:hypothetical protein
MSQSPKPTLDGPRAKLRRSGELLDDLEREIAASRKEIGRSGNLPHKFAFRDEVDLDNVRWRVCRCVKILHKPPENWGLVAGDAMHNARTALDHLAARLVELDGNKPTKKSAFPIWDEEPKTKDKKNQFEKTIAGMSKAHQESIRRLQPWKNPGTKESAMLVALGVLDNLDKHNDLVPLFATTTPDSSVAPLSPALPSATEVKWNPNVEVKPNAEIFRWRATSTNVPSAIKVFTAV